MKTVLVIGGGVTGLAAMYELQKWKTENQADVRLLLVESSSELGGKIATVGKGEFIMESGADSIVSRKANAMNFVEELQLESEVVYNATGLSYLFTDGELKLIPKDSIFGIPTSIESLASSTLVSAEGKVEALKDFYTKNETFTKNDSIGEFLEYFLGKELVEKQIAPVLSGVYSGDLKELTIASTLPYLLDYKEQYGSIIKGLEANREKFQSGGDKKFLSFKGGLSVLSQAYEDRLHGVEIFKESKVKQITKANRRYQVVIENGESIEADYVLLCIPHNAAQELLRDEELEAEFGNFKASSLISIYVGFDIPDSQLPEHGTGFITSNTDLVRCNACTWTSRKWTHTSTSGNLLVRLFYKSSHPGFDELQQKTEDELLQVALDDIDKSLGIQATPVTSLVTKWEDSMPNYLISHPHSVKAIEEKLAFHYPGMKIAGCSYYGVGIPDCIEDGKKRAREIIGELT